MYADNLFTLDNLSSLPAEAVASVERFSSRDELTVNESDVVFVSAVQYGRTVLEKRFSGFSSVAELLRVVRMCLEGLSGLVSITLRNRDCGQSAKRVVRLGRPVPMFAAMA